MVGNFSSGVVSLRRLTEHQRHFMSSTWSGSLDRASDRRPISQSSGSVPSGRTNAAEAERVRKSKDETRGNRADVFGTIATAIRSRPATSIAIVAALAYIWRATR